MEGGLHVMAVSEIVVADHVARGFEKEIEIPPKQDVPADRAHADHRQDEHRIAALMVIAASVPRSIDELEPPPLRNRLQEIPMPVGAGNVDRGIGGFLPEMRMQIGPPAAHDKRIGFQRMTGNSKPGGLRHVVSVLTG